MSLARARADFNRLLKAEFSTECTFENGDESAVVRALVTNHNLRIDPNEGTPVNTPTVYVTVSESDLIAEDYTTRDASNKVNMRRHKVSFLAANGVSQTYMVQEVRPDEHVGVLTLELGKWQ